MTTEPSGTAASRAEKIEQRVRDSFDPDEPPQVQNDRFVTLVDGSEVREDDVHCWSCGDRFNGCPRCADEDGVK